MSLLWQEVSLELLHRSSLVQLCYIYIYIYFSLFRFNRKDNLLRHKKTHIANFGGGARKRSVFGVIDKSVVKCVASLHGDTDSPPSTETVTTASLAGDLE